MIASIEAANVSLYSHFPLVIDLALSALAGDQVAIRRDVVDLMVVLEGCARHVWKLGGASPLSNLMG